MHDKDLRSLLAPLGVLPGTAKVHLCASASGNTYGYWRGKLPTAQLFTSLSDAEGSLTSGQNDLLLLSPDSHSLASALTWSLSNAQLIGLAPGGLGMNKRARIGMSTTFTPMITVSGSGNLFKDIYTMHGTAAGDYIGWNITGARNRFDGCHFGGPMNAAQGDHASYEGVAIDGSENVFENCVFGTDSTGRDETSSNVTLGAGTLTIFRNCLFLASLTDGNPVFIKAENTTSYTWALFDNCHFMAFNTNYATAMTVACACTGGNSCALNFAPSCTFQNVTALSDATDDDFVWYPVTFSTTTDTAALISAKLSV